MSRPVKIERVEKALELLAKLVPAPEVERAIADGFGISLRSARRVVADARRHLAADTDASITERRNQIRITLMEVARRALARDHLSTALRALSELVSLDGLASPVRSEVTIHDPDGAITSPEAQRARVEELRAQAAAASHVATSDEEAEDEGPIVH
jgi:hypothetical protein